jgi:hypothetical protein
MKKHFFIWIYGKKCRHRLRDGSIWEIFDKLRQSECVTEMTDEGEAAVGGYLQEAGFRAWPAFLDPVTFGVKAVAVDIHEVDVIVYGTGYAAYAVGFLENRDFIVGLFKQLISRRQARRPGSDDDGVFAGRHLRSSHVR